jgi:hypothetical protein
LVNNRLHVWWQSHMIVYYNRAEQFLWPSDVATIVM